MAFFLLPRGVLLVARGVGLRPLPKGLWMGGLGGAARRASWGGGRRVGLEAGAVLCRGVLRSGGGGAWACGDGGGSGGGPWRRWAWTVLGGSVAWNGAGRWRRLTLRGACCALLGGCSNYALRFARSLV